jgi:hypothetical protein
MKLNCEEGDSERNVKQITVQKVLIWDKQNTTTESCRHNACIQFSIPASFFVVCQQTAAQSSHLVHSYDDRELALNNFFVRWNG